MKDMQPRSYHNEETRQRIQTIPPRPILLGSSFIEDASCVNPLSSGTLAWKLRGTFCLAYFSVRIERMFTLKE